MTDEHSPQDELEMDGEDQDSGHDGAQAEDEDLDDDLNDQEEEEEQERDEEASPRSSAVLPPVRGAKPTSPAGRAVATGTSITRPAASGSDEDLPYIDDNVSKIWVGVIVAVFALILAYALLFGKGGALTPPTPSPEPTPSPSPTASATVAPSPSLTVAPSVTATPGASGCAPLPSASPGCTSVPATPSPAPSPS